MRSGVLSAGIAGLLLVIPSSAMAEEHDYRSLPGGITGLQADFVDAATIERRAGQVSYEVLTIAPTSASGDLAGSVYRMELTCGWGTLRLVGSNFWLGSPSHQISLSAPPSPETAGPAFLQENSSAYEIYRWLCLGADAPAGPGAPTAAAAIAQARAQFLGKTGSIPVDPIMRKPGFPASAINPHRYSVAVREPRDGGLVFVDWAGLARKGDVVLANTVWVLGPQTFRLHGRVALRSIVFDCRINRAKVVLRSTWRSDGLRLAFTRVEEPATDVTPGSVEAGLLKAVCPGVEPSETLPNVEAIIAYSNQAGSSSAPQSR